MPAGYPFNREMAMFTFNRHFVLTGAVLAAAALTGCSNTPTYPPAPMFAPPPVDVDARISGWTYLLGPGDSVSVFVWRNPEVSGGFPDPSRRQDDHEPDRGHAGSRQDPHPAGA
jgi:hypothetical protein